MLKTKEKPDMFDEQKLVDLFIGGALHGLESYLISYARMKGYRITDSTASQILSEDELVAGAAKILARAAIMLVEAKFDC